jgi:hypothetical protein
MVARASPRAWGPIYGPKGFDAKLKCPGEGQFGPGGLGGEVATDGDDGFCFSISTTFISGTFAFEPWFVN